MALRAMLLALAAMIWLAPGAKAQFESATLFAVLNGGNVCEKTWCCAAAWAIRMAPARLP